MNEYIILQTASVAHEFGFYSANEPDYSALKSRYGANFDDKKLIIEIANGKFSVFMSKIPCKRSDSIERKMFYGLVAHGTVGNNENAETVKKLAYAYIQNDEALGEKFDEVFSNEYLAKFDNLRKTKETESAIYDKIVSIANGLENISTSGNSVKSGIVYFCLKNSGIDVKSYLNLLTEVSAQTFDGISLLIVTDCIYQSTVENIENNIPSPVCGIVLAEENKSGKSEIEKKKMNTQFSPNCSTHGKNRTIFKLFLMSLILNVVLLICLMSLRSSVKDLKESMLEKDSLLLSANSEIKLLGKLATPYYRTAIIDVKSFTESGIIKIKDSAGCYDYAFQVITPDTISIYRDGGEIFRNNMKRLSDFDKLYKLFVEFNEKMKPYLNEP